MRYEHDGRVVRLVRPAKEKKLTDAAGRHYFSRYVVDAASGRRLEPPTCI